MKTLFPATFASQSELVSSVALAAVRTSAIEIALAAMTISWTNRIKLIPRRLELQRIYLLED
jgi:hypothetical protein